MRISDWSSDVCSSDLEVETGIAAAAAARVVGEDKVILGADALMGSEDFAYMLQARPGCYIWIGNGTDGGPAGCAVHHPRYDFNYLISVIRPRYWAALAAPELPR